ncbi:MAG: helix-turn-helix domain-containing protein [Candidatus Hodarchaeales archaeon]|jgi:hypothetical protein
MAISSTNTNTKVNYDSNNFWSQNYLEENVFQEKKANKRYLLERDIVNFLILTGNVGKTRKELVLHLDIPRTTVYDSLNRMDRNGLIEVDYKLSKKGKGRPQTLFYLKGFNQGINR